MQWQEAELRQRQNYQFLHEHYELSSNVTSCPGNIFNFKTDSII